MPFEYAYSDLGNKDPYPVAGRVRASGGLLVAGLGGFQLLHVPESVGGQGRRTGVLQLCNSTIALRGRTGDCRSPGNPSVPVLRWVQFPRRIAPPRRGRSE